MPLFLVFILLQYLSHKFNLILYILSLGIPIIQSRMKRSQKTYFFFALLFHISTIITIFVVIKYFPFEYQQIE